MKLAQKLVIGYFRARLNLLAAFSPKRAAAKAFTIFRTPWRKPRKGMPPVFNQAEKLLVPLDALTLHGYRWIPKPADCAPAFPSTEAPQPHRVLIIHGFESAAKNFDRYIVPLRRKGYEVLAFDAPGHGSSSGKQLDPVLYARAIKAVYDQYGPIHGFMAHSLGGLALMHFLETIPHTSAIRVALIAPATETTTAIDTFFRFLDLNAKVRQAFDQLIVDISGHQPAHFSIRRAMQHVQAQVLWVHDEDDELTPLSDALKVRDDGHPFLQFVITKGLGHRAIYKDNKVTKQVIEFL